MSRISRVVVLVTALMSVCGVLSSTAGAVTWDVSGPEVFTAHSGPGSLSGAGKTLSCTGSTATGAVTTTMFTGAVFTNAVHGNVNFSGCSLAGTALAVSCTYGLNATGQTGHAISATVDLVSPNGCTLSVGGVGFCRIEGQTPGTYHNPETGADARLTIPTSNSLVATNVATACPLGNGTTVSLTALTFTVTGVGPTITRTP
jgi:hypothetical protein